MRTASRRKPIQCGHCGKDFLPVQKAAKFCSRPCTWAEARRPRQLTWTVNDQGCHECTSHQLKGGYPYVNVWRDGRKVYTRASRAVYEAVNGPVPRSLCVLHKCDNARCINPDHLELGTQKKNVRDAFARGRIPVGSKRHNAKLSEDDVRAILNSDAASIRELSRRYGVHNSTICRILQGERWRHVTPQPR